MIWRWFCISTWLISWMIERLESMPVQTYITWGGKSHHSGVCRGQLWHRTWLGTVSENPSIPSFMFPYLLAVMLSSRPRWFHLHWWRWSHDQRFQKSGHVDGLAGWLARGGSHSQNSHTMAIPMPWLGVELLGPRAAGEVLNKQKLEWDMGGLPWAWACWACAFALRTASWLWRFIACFSWAFGHVQATQFCTGGWLLIWNRQTKWSNVGTAIAQLVLQIWHLIKRVCRVIHVYPRSQDVSFGFGCRYKPSEWTPRLGCILATARCKKVVRRCHAMAFLL